MIESTRLGLWSVFASSTVIVAGALAYGCAASGDNSGGDDDAGAAGETSGGDSASHDDGASGFDAGQFDGGSGNDAGAGGDTGAVDAPSEAAFVCVPVVVPQPDAGVDAGSDASSDAAIESGSDASSDAASDAAVDSGVDAGGVCAPPPPGQCGPGDVSTFQPVWHPPLGMHLGACTSSQIDGYYTACLGPLADPFTCQSFTTSNTTCTQCISTNDTASSYGALINDTNIGIVEVNVAGCIALLEPCNLDCAKAYQADSQCGEASCGFNCPVSDQTSFNAYEACVTTSDSCGCSARNQRAQCAAAITGSQHPAAQCQAGATFQALYTTVAGIFCGP